MPSSKNQWSDISGLKLDWETVGFSFLQARWCYCCLSEIEDNVMKFDEADGFCLKT